MAIPSNVFFIGVPSPEKSLTYIMREKSKKIMTADIGDPSRKRLLASVHDHRHWNETMEKNGRPAVNPILIISASI
jgi:hypothetical protein